MPLRRARLNLQELGERSLPSVVPLHVPNFCGPVAVPPASHPLRGIGDGTYHAPAVTIDSGASYSLVASATLRNLGSFSVTGAVQGVGFIANGRATGYLILSSDRGTITLLLHSAVQPAFSPIPSELVYSIKKGTGDFQHLTGYGTVQTKFTPALVASGLPDTGSIHLFFS